MISILSKHFSPPGSVVSYQAEAEGKYAWFLATWHPESEHILEEIQAEIKLEIINAEPLKLSKLEIENWLRDFFSEYHWKLHARLRKTELREKGISLFFGLLYENELIFVQFGRMLCASLDAKGMVQLGRSWKHYHIKTADELELIGYAENDIKVKSHRVLLEEKQHLLIIPSPIALKLLDQYQDLSSLEALLDSYKGDRQAAWLHISRLSELQKPRKRKLNRLQISSIVLILLAIVAVLYVAFGNRFIDQGLHKTKMLVQSKSISSLEDLPNTLKLRNADIMKIMDRVVNAPARNIETRVAWTKDLPYEVSAIPAFDLEHIYIASGKNLFSYNKKNQELDWNLALEEDIITMNRTQHSLVLILENKRVIGIKENGNIAWALPLNALPEDDEEPALREVSSTDDPRIDGSIVVIPEQNRISIVDSNRGELFSSIELKQELRFLSAYDSFDSCFYAVVGASLLKIDLIILN